VNQRAFIERVARVTGAAVGEASLGDGPAVFVGKREIAHFHPDGSLDVRLTKKLIRARHDELRADARVTLRPGASDWLEVSIVTSADTNFAARLATDAVAANRCD
jgi:hypothetical protein